MLNGGISRFLAKYLQQLGDSKERDVLTVETAVGLCFFDTECFSMNYCCCV